MSVKTLGCIFCGQSITTSPPDSSHTESHRILRMNGNWVDPDFRFMNAKCPKYQMGNWIY